MKQTLVILILYLVFIGCDNLSNKKAVDTLNTVTANKDTLKKPVEKPDKVFNESVVIDKQKELSLLKQKTLLLFNNKKDSNSFGLQKIYFKKDTTGEYCSFISFVLVGDLFRNRNKYAIIGYSQADKVLHIEIKKFVENKWQNKINKNIFPIDINEFYWNTDTVVKFVDIDGDTTKDLMIMKSFSIIHDLYTYEACVIKSDTFHFVKNYDKIVNPIYNYNGRYISSCFNGGNNTVVCREYKIRNFKATMTGKPEYSGIDDWIKK